MSYLHRRLGSLVVGALTALTACEGDAGNATSGADVDDFRATVDGALWVADAATIEVRGSPTLRSTITISGTRASASGDYKTLALALGYINGPKIYPLGVNPTSNAGGTATITEHVAGNTSVWATDLNGGRGTLRVTSMTEERILAVFEFIAPPEAGGTATETRTAAGGFDLKLPPLYQPPMGDDYGSSMSASIDDEPWNGATVVGAGDPSAGTLSFGGMTTGLSLSFTTATPVQAGTTYDQTGIRLSAAGNGGTWGDGAGDVSSVTVTALDARRIAGTFTATLAPVTGATAPLVIAVGAFDVRIDVATTP
jgi:hypothetical protein